MNQAVTKTDPKTIERVVIQGDLAQLSEEERLNYYGAVCESLGLNPLTQPFAYLKLSGKLTLYARKDACEQLRKLNNVSLKIMSEEKVSDLYKVRVMASLPSGRFEEATGVLPIAGLAGEALANALMKCETKAKRRATLAVCGLGFLDESEVESIPGATVEPARPQKAIAAPKQGPIIFGIDEENDILVLLDPLDDQGKAAFLEAVGVPLNLAPMWLYPILRDLLRSETAPEKVLAKYAPARFLVDLSEEQVKSVMSRLQATLKRQAEKAKEATVS